MALAQHTIKAADVSPQSLRALLTHLDTRGPEALRSALVSLTNWLSEGRNVTISAEQAPTQEEEPTMTDVRTLTTRDAVALATILEAAQTNARVRWVDDDHTDGVNEGTARHLVKDPETAGFLGSGDDIRDGYLRVTTVAGFEAWLPVSQLIEMVSETTFVIDN
jgi:hypothetical protein